MLYIYIYWYIYTYRENRVEVENANVETTHSRPFCPSVISYVIYSIPFVHLISWPWSRCGCPHGITLPLPPPRSILIKLSDAYGNPSQSSPVYLYVYAYNIGRHAHFEAQFVQVSNFVPCAWSYNYWHISCFFCHKQDIYIVVTRGEPLDGPTPVHIYVWFN